MFRHNVDSYTLTYISVHSTVPQTGMVGNWEVVVVVYGLVVHDIGHIGVACGREGYLHHLLVHYKMDRQFIEEELSMFLRPAIQQQFGCLCMKRQKNQKGMSW